MLLWAKDAADLYVSRWEHHRLTYPAPMAQSPEVEDRRIVALGTVGRITWWAQRVDKDLVLYTWRAGEDEPKDVLFENVGAKVDDAKWLGGQRLLIRENYARTVKLAVRDGDQTHVTEPGHIKKAQLSEFQLIVAPDGEENTSEGRLARLTDGVCCNGSATTFNRPTRSCCRRAGGWSRSSPCPAAKRGPCNATATSCTG